jgi:DNA-binding transcriptional LysR family regulator
MNKSGPMARMDLRHLRYFVAIAEQGSFSAAATVLGIQQPPLSQQIRDLEDALGFALFMRHRKGVTLTAGGAVLLAHARRLLSATESAITEARMSAEGKAGLITIGFTSSAVAHATTPRLIREFREGHPKVEVRFREANAARVTEMVERGDIDLGFLRRPVLDIAGMRYDAIGNEPMLLVLPHDHRLALSQPPAIAGSGSKVKVSALRTERFILVRRPGAMGMYSAFIEACRKEGFEPNVVAEVEQMLTNIALVAAGLGISVVPASMYGFHAESVQFRAMAGGPLLDAPLNLLSRQDAVNPALTRFLALAHELAVPRRAANRAVRASRS